MKFLLIALAIIGSACALTFSLEAHKEECFYEEVTEVGRKIGLSFQVSQGGLLDIDVTVFDPQDQLVYKGEKETEGKYTFMATYKGVYRYLSASINNIFITRFCFSNKMSTYTPKTVTFHIDAGNAKQNLFGAAKPEDLTPLETSVMHLADGLTAIQAEQEYMKVRERVHRNTSESTNSRVLWWSMFECIILVGMSLWQIYYLRRFFEVKTPV